MLRILIVFSFMGIYLLARAQVRDTLYQLQEVQIRAVKHLRNRALVPMQVLSTMELNRINGLSVADAVRYFSGVQLKDYGGVGGLKTINVRSMGTQHTAVFYDGIALENAQNGQVDLGRFALDNLEELALYNGQNPDLLQPARAYASANALYLKTKIPSIEEGKKSLLSTALKTGSFGLIDASATLDYRLREKINARFALEGMNANGHYPFRYTNGVYDTVATRTNGDISAFRLEGGLFGTPDSLRSWSAKIYHYQSQRGLPGAIVANRFDFNQRQWDNQTFIQGSFQQQVDARYTLLLNGKYAWDQVRYLDPDMVTVDGFLDNHYHQQEGYFSIANQYAVLPFWKVALNADYQYNQLDANLYRFAYPKRNTFLIALATQWQIDRLQVQANVLSTTVKESVKESIPAADQQKFTPTLLFSYQPLADRPLYFRAFYKSIFRMPTFNDLYYTFVGNTFLKPEYAKQYDFGLTYHRASSGRFIKDWDVELDAYYNQVTDKIVAVPGANLFRWTMLNLGKVEIKGIETNVKTYGTINDQLNFSLGLQYTFQQALDSAPESNTYRQQIPYTPRHSGSFLASVYKSAWAVHYSFIYTGERYSQPANIPANDVLPWYTHDLSGEYTLGLGYHTWRIRAEVNNVFNQAYEVILNFPMPGRSYRFTLSYQL